MTRNPKDRMPSPAPAEVQEFVNFLVSKRRKKTPTSWLNAVGVASPAEVQEFVERIKAILAGETI